MKKFSIMGVDCKYIELSAPLKIYYDITTECNLKCEFCFKGNSKTDCSLDNAKRIIKKVADASVMDIVLLGGEPFACQFLFPAIEFARECGLNVGIITNGTLISEENAKKLKHLVNNSISVSIHAHTNALHDEISGGCNVLDKIIEGLHELNKYGIIPELSFTPLKKNVDHLYDTISNVLNQGILISDVLVNRLIPAGRAIDGWMEKEVTLADQIKLFEQMDRLSIAYPNIAIATGDAIPFCMVESKYWKYIIRCDYAITLGWINENNLFGKCMCRGATGFESLEEKTIKELWKTSKSFLDHRYLCCIPDECRICEWLPLCGGGCACSSYDRKTVTDVYLDNSKKATMPSLYSEIPKKSSTGLEFKCKYDSSYNMRSKFIIRKEKESSNIHDEIYLFIPLSSGAIIQDVIQPENGDMLWVNSLDKQIILYMQAGLTVIEIARSIAFEFDLPKEYIVQYVINTINFLNDCNMVDEHECKEIL